MVCLKRANLKHTTDAVPPHVKTSVGDLKEKLRLGQLGEEIPREDFRKLRIFSIDPLGSKDLDDALSITWDAAVGKWQVGVHIADVAHFIKPNSPIDE
mmetsp:Transcript_115820/g.248878  ORF Transcript_115820/g.248878 Transcript_115820/m.248878 type:complete len:98 (+) Transcript_115820:1177-1470(+)